MQLELYIKKKLLNLNFKLTWRITNERKGIKGRLAVFKKKRGLSDER